MGLLILLAFSLVALAQLYRSRAPRRLKSRRRWFQWLPKYWMEIQLSADTDDLDSVIWELTDRLGPLGFDLRSQTDEELVFKRGSRVGDVTAVEARRVVVRVPLPITCPTRVEVHYEASAVFDTGDLSRFCHSLVEQQAVDAPLRSSDAPVETGNPYQSPT